MTGLTEDVGFTAAFEVIGLAASPSLQSIYLSWTDPTNGPFNGDRVYYRAAGTAAWTYFAPSAGSERTR